MADYINRDKLYEQIRLVVNRSYLGETSALNISAKEILSIIADMSVDDVELVKHGRWIVENEYSIRCSECCFNRASIKMPMDYCPNCGARMDNKIEPEFYLF